MSANSRKTISAWWIIVFGVLFHLTWITTFALDSNDVVDLHTGIRGFIATAVCMLPFFGACYVACRIP